MADDYCSQLGPLFSPELFRRFVIPYLRKGERVEGRPVGAKGFAPYQDEVRAVEAWRAAIPCRRVTGRSPRLAADLPSSPR